MFSTNLIAKAEALIAEMSDAGLTVATAESCTGGLIIALLTEVSGASAVVDRGFVTYSNRAKTELLGVPTALIASYGAVSAEAAIAMAHGALQNSGAHISVAVTGVAGPNGGSMEKPVGLVHLAGARGAHIIARELRLGNIGRSPIRVATLHEAMSILRALMQ